MRWRRIAGVVLATLALSAAPSRAELVPLPGAPVVDGPVTTMAQASGRVFIGGSFTSVGPRTGPLVHVDATTGALARGAPSVAQGIGRTAVRAITPDGAGGYYAAGDFSVVDGVGRQSLVHVRRDGTVDPAFLPPAFASTAGAPEITTLVAGSGRLYVGGRFTLVGAAPRVSLVALDAGTGALLFGFDARLAGAAPGAVPEVEDLALAGTALYVGGNFAAAGGANEPGLVALGAATGNRLAAFDAEVSAPGADVVEDLLLSGSTLYAVGGFSAAGGRAVPGLAALEAGTGRAVAGFEPPAFTPAMGATFPLTALTKLGQALYVGGPFTALGTRRRTGIAALDAVTGTAIDSFRPPALRAGPGSPAPQISALTVRRSTVIVGGRFVVSNTSPPDANLLGLDAATGALRSTFNPRVNGDVAAVAPTTTGVLVGGASHRRTPRRAPGWPR